ncbi:DUF302 domain-containing protein [Cellulomonas humilata]|uniref:Uncharacterized protein (DUF302 family) n=1 Tax=Cellulomonas humilata TaxID=144055 RepID=A0ABU0EH97_9CELL|nr:DUF302 domain-containing protein [Cellulomonas humilata]MDQ0374640.1 uncharacterized protein (DUF302 family) [Cellulomonas humilata]
MSYALTATTDLSFPDALSAVREALAAQGFGVLTEIDLAATLKAKLDVDIAPQVILGACNPVLANEALATEPQIGLLLPCNVVVRSVEDGRTVVEAVDPDVLVQLSGNDALQRVAADAGTRLRAALEAVPTS